MVYQTWEEKIQKKLPPWLTSQGVAYGLIFLIVALLLHRFPLQYVLGHGTMPTDFGVYLKAIERVRHGLTPYVVTDFSPYKYSPGVLGLAQLLPQDPTQALVLFSTLSIAGFGFCLIIGARYQTWKSVLLLLIGVGLAWKGVLETLDYGQLELLLLWIAIGAAALHRRQPLLAGLLAGALPWFKLPWALYLFPLILGPVASLSAPGRKEKRVRLFFSGYCFSWFIWGAAVPSLVFGTERAKLLSQEWLGILKAQPAALYYSDINQSAWVTALRWLGQENLFLAIGVVLLLTGLVLGRFTVRSLSSFGTRETFAWISPWLILIQLLNPLSWRWGSVFLVGAPFSIAGAGAHYEARKLRAFVGFLALVLWLLQLNPIAQVFGFHHWSELHGFGLVTGYWFIVLILCI